MLTSGIMRMMISVKDMDESVAYYRDVLEMSVVRREVLTDGQICRRYGLEGGTTAEVAILKNDVQPTLIELIQFTPNTGRYIREGAQPYDFGLFDVALRTRNAAEAQARVKSKGYKIQCPAVEYTADWAKVTVKEAVIVGPDEVPNAFIERITNPTPIKGLFGEFTDNAQVVEDMEEAIRFYADTLGLPKVFDMVLPKNLVNEIVGIPLGEDVRMTMFVKGKTPLVECLEYSIKGKSLAPVAKPSNLGLFMIAFETDDLVAQVEKIRANGFRILSGPVDVPDLVFNQIRSITVSGPSGIMIELYEK